MGVVQYCASADKTYYYYNYHYYHYYYINFVQTSVTLCSFFFFFLHFLMDFLDVGGLKISQEKNTVSQVQYEKKECIFFFISEHVNLLL